MIKKTEITDAIILAKQLIEKPSITPDDAGCQALLSDILSTLGFHVEQFDHNRVKNLWARYGTQEPLFVFAGHTDVVPTGDLSSWISPPFEPEIRENYLYGRGACDMKGGLAAMLVATECFLKKHHENTDKTQKFKGSIGFLITSGEEGDDFEDGTPYVMKKLAERNEIPRYCIVGEPSSSTVLGDTIKVGRRGSLTGYLKILGKQGHVAYPQLAENPMHRAAGVLNELVNTTWDNGNNYFPATSFQITKINADSGGSNVIPGELEITFNFRYASVSTHEELKEKVTAILNKHELKYELTWRLSGLPFLTPSGKLLDAAQEAIKTICGLTPLLSTSGGTSDGRFIAPYGVDVIELGLINATIHQINESTSVDALQQLSVVYEEILGRIFQKGLIN
jgi:succinyl-diaminopimelate desuccinylase